MTAVYVIAIVVLLVVGFWLVSAWQPLGRNQPVEEFPRLVRSLLLARENGSILEVRHRSSNVIFEFERAEGTGSEAVLLFKIARPIWTEREIDRLRHKYTANGFECIAQSNGARHHTHVRIPVHDIWDIASGATGAHAARLLLEQAGLPQSARFNVKETGRASRRVVQRLKNGQDVEI